MRKYIRLPLMLVVLMGMFMSAPIWAQNTQKQVRLKYKKVLNGEVVEMDTLITGDATLDIHAIMKELGIDEEQNARYTQKRIQIQSDSLSTRTVKGFDLDLDDAALEGLDEATKARVLEALEEAKRQLQQMEDPAYKDSLVQKKANEVEEEVFIIQGEKEGEQVLEWEGEMGDSVHVFVDAEEENIEKEVIIDERGQRKVIITSARKNEAPLPKHPSATQKTVQQEMEVNVSIDDSSSSPKYVIRINTLIREIDKVELEALKLSGVNTDNSMQVEGLNFYPNPNEGRFTLEFSPRESGTIHIQIVDIQGRPIYEEVLPEFTGYYQKKLDISRQAKGMYFINLGQNGKYLNKKIIFE